MHYVGTTGRYLDGIRESYGYADVERLYDKVTQDEFRETEPYFRDLDVRLAGFTFYLVNPDKHQYKGPYPDKHIDPYLGQNRGAEDPARL